MVRREGLSSGNFLDSNEAEVVWLDLSGIGGAEVKAIEATSGFDSAGELENIFFSVTLKQNVTSLIMLFIRGLLIRTVKWARSKYPVWTYS